MASVVASVVVVLAVVASVVVVLAVVASVMPLQEVKRAAGQCSKACSQYNRQYSVANEAVSCTSEGDIEAELSIGAE